MSEEKQYQLPATVRFLLSGLGLIAIIAAVVLLFEKSFILRVENYEQAVRFNFGKVDPEPLGAGFNWRLPYPIQDVEIINVETERKVRIGFSMDHQGNRVHIDRDAMILTSDGNLVDIEAEVNYHINDVMHYVLNVEDQEETVIDASEAALKTIVGQYPIDEILTGEKSSISTDVTRKLQQILDSYKLGVIVSRVQFLKVLNPLKVREAFESVEAAKVDSAIAVELALGYENQKVPVARGEAVQKIKEAEAYAMERVARAEGDVAGFTELLAKYKISKRVTRKRMYLETMEEVLPGKKKVIVDEKGSVVNLMGLGGLK